MGKEKVISMVKYHDMSILEYTEGAIREVPMDDIQLFFNFFDISITPEEYIKDYRATIRGNCLGDIIKFEIYTLGVDSMVYENILNINHKDSEKTVMDFFEQSFFKSNSSVLLKGVYTLLQENGNILGTTH